MMSTHFWGMEDRYDVSSSDIIWFQLREIEKNINITLNFAVTFCNVPDTPNAVYYDICMTWLWMGSFAFLEWVY